MSKRVAENDSKVLHCVAYHKGGWRPFPGSHAAAKRLAKRGLIIEAGISVYVITDKGREALKNN